MIHSIFLENFKGTTANLDLKQLNIFRGPSGSGKSTWLEAVRVAILGHDPGYGKTLSETMAFASDPRMSVAVSKPEVIVKRIFEEKGLKGATQTITVNGEKKTQAIAETFITEHFGRFPMMLNPDEFFDMSDDKKITFLFGLSNTETNSKMVRRNCIVEILNQYTDAVPLILEYEFKLDDYHPLDGEAFDKLVALAIDKIAQKDVGIGRALTKIFAEFLNTTLNTGQETVAMYAHVLKGEINATRRAKQDAEAANRKLMEEKADKMKLVNYNETENQAEIEKIRGEVSEIEKELHARDKLRDAKERLTSGLSQHQASVVMLSENVAKLEAVLLSKEDKKEAVASIYGYENANHAISEQIFIAEVRRGKLEKKYAKLIEEHNAATTPKHCPTCDTEISCPECGTLTEKGKLESYKGLEKASEKLKETEEYLKTRHDELEENDKWGLELSSVLAQEHNHEEAHEVAKQHLKDVIKLVKEQEENLEKIEEPGAGDDVLKTQLKGLKSDLGVRLVAQKNHDWLRTLSGTIARANETISNSTSMLEALSDSIASVKEVRDDLTDSATSAIENVCNDLLQKVDERFYLMYLIEGGKFDIRCVNVSGKEVPFKTLSGGEKVLYLSAQLLALMDRVDPKLKILEVEMGELSGNLVPPFMDALEVMTEHTDIQVVLSSCHGDFEVNSEAWAVHDMGDE